MVCFTVNLEMNLYFYDFKGMFVGGFGATIFL
jgi:hypothetical protein